MAETLYQTAAARPRIAALDAARAVGVVAMVVGHTLDALLASAVRLQPAVELYWKARGLTAPLFLLVSGWAVTVAMLRSRARGAALVRARLPRVGLLLLLGLALRWPGWNVPGLLAGDLEVWRHLLAFDALQAIAVALLLAALAFAFLPRTRDRVLAFTLIAALAVTFGLRPPSAPATSLGGIALEQAFGGSSPFPVVPWIAYFVAGGLVGLLAGDGGRRAALAMGLAGAVLGALVFLDVGDMPPAHPVLIGFRIGAVLLLLSLLAAVPAGVARALAPVGRASLAVYAIHVPIVYGWSTHAGLAARVGPTLSFATALGVAACVLAASFGLARAWALARRGAGWAWDRRGAVADAVGALVGGPRGARD